MWHAYLSEGRYPGRGSAVLPAFAIIGLGLMLFPLDRKQSRAKHPPGGPATPMRYPPVWKGVFAVAAAAGLGNFLAVLLMRP